jgi:hypothetical protein
LRKGDVFENESIESGINAALDYLDIIPDLFPYGSRQRKYSFRIECPFSELPGRTEK